jgi:hypothetical protein
MENSIKKLRVLVGCESSGVVRQAFRNLGHDAWSCDLQAADDDSSYHFQCDVLTVLDKNWDLAIFHPTCTYLTNAGVRWLHEHVQSRKGNKPVISGAVRWDYMREGAEFFKKLLNSSIPKIAVENPIPHKYAIELIGRKYDQLIQPYMFGHPERKATCLWLKNLPKLVPTNNVKDYMLTLPKKEQQRLHYLPPSPDRWKLRSKTFDGIAQAMAQQWGTER